jgi:hypothetical protein
VAGHLRRKASVDRDLSSAGGLTPIEGRIVEVIKADRPLQLVGAIADEEHPGHVDLVRYLPRPASHSSSVNSVGSPRSKQGTDLLGEIGGEVLTVKRVRDLRDLSFKNAKGVGFTGASGAEERQMDPISRCSSKAALQILIPSGDQTIQASQFRVAQIASSSGAVAFVQSKLADWAFSDAAPPSKTTAATAETGNQRAPAHRTIS